MQFPVTLKHTLHKFGGRITEIKGIHHETAKPKSGRSQDIWYFVGTVMWDDGSGVRDDAIISPNHICSEGDEGKAEVDPLFDALSEYLLEHGEWCDHTSKHEGWYANVR